MKSVSEKIKKHCKAIPSSKLRLAFKPSRTIRNSLACIKNRIPPEKRKGVVYKIPCQDCDQVYVGEMGRTLKRRIAEHKFAVRKKDEDNGIAVHVSKSKHKIDWENADITGSEPWYWRRRVKEALRIRAHGNTVLGLYVA